MHSKGFTIVELLIVIVAIAILAAISIVAYTGIQARANSIKIESIIRQYKTGLELYYADNGAYPATYNDNNDYICLGSTADFPAQDGFAEGQCSRNSGASWGAVAMNELNEKLAPYMSDTPGALIDTYSWTTSSGRTFWQRGIEAEINDQWAYMQYFVKGNQSCPTGEKEYRAADDVTMCYVNMFDHL